MLVISNAQTESPPSRTPRGRGSRRCWLVAKWSDGWPRPSAAECRTWTSCAPCFWAPAACYRTRSWSLPARSPVGVPASWSPYLPNSQTSSKHESNLIYCCSCTCCFGIFRTKSFQSWNYYKKHNYNLHNFWLFTIDTKAEGTTQPSLPYPDIFCRITQ